MQITFTSIRRLIFGLSTLCILSCSKEDPKPECETITFQATRDSNRSIVFSGVEGGTAPYTYQVGEGDFQAGEVFPNNYPNGSYKVSVKDVNGCVGVKIISSILVVTTGISGKWVVFKSSSQFNSDAVEWKDGDGENYIFETNGDLTHSYKPRPGGGFYENDKGKFVYNDTTKEIKFTWEWTSMEYLYKVKSLTQNEMVLTASYTEKGDQIKEEIILHK